MTLTNTWSYMLPQPFPPPFLPLISPLPPPVHLPFSSSLPLLVNSCSLLPRMQRRLSRLSWAIKRHSMGEGGLPCSKNCADTHTRGFRDSSPLHWDLEPQRERQVSTEDKGSIEDEQPGNGRKRVELCQNVWWIERDVRESGKAEWAGLFDGMESENYR